MLNPKPLASCLLLAGLTVPAFGQLTLTQSHAVAIGGSSGPPDAADVAVFDLDGDGNQDIITYNSDGVYTPPTKDDFLAILLGNGDGTFQAPVETGAIGFTRVGPGGTYSRLVKGEFTGDAYPDLVLTHHQTTQVALVPNDGAGGFLPAILFDTGSFVSSLEVADFNEDGLDDVLAVSLSGYNLSFLAGNGTGLNAPASYASGLLSTHQPRTFAVADLDGDDNLDVLIPYGIDEFGTQVDEAIGFYGNGDGTFNMTTPVNITLAPSVLAGSVSNVQVADLDMDGYQDIVAMRDFYSGTGAIHVHIAWGTASGWGTPLAYALSGQEWLSYCSIADIDFDGNLDIVTVCNGPYVLEVLLGDGARGFAAQGQIDVSPGAGIEAALIADVTGDTRLDIVVGTVFSGFLLVYRNDTPGPMASCSWYCGTGANAATDGFGILSPPNLGGTFDVVVNGCHAGSYAAALFAYVGAYSFMHPLGEVLIDFTHPGGEILGMPAVVGNPAVFSLGVPPLPVLAGMTFNTQAVSVGGSNCLHCAYQCTLGF